MYSKSSCSELTPQGIAIKDVAVRFGNGKTMPYSPCKRGYIAIVRGEKMYACTLHNESRMKRIRHEGCVFRSGERDLNDLWNKDLEVDDTSFKRKNGDLGAEKPIREGGGFEK